MVAVWKPGFAKAGTPTIAYTYQVPASGAKSITTKTAVTNAAGEIGQTTSVDILSSTGKSLETQSDAPGGGRTVSESFYDSDGRKVRSNNHWYTTGVPDSVLIRAADSAVDSRTVVVFDGAGRQVLSVDYAGRSETRRTQTVYAWLTTLTMPPTGASPTAVIVDAYGRTVISRQYATPPVVNGTSISGGTFRDTIYTYDAEAQLVTITDPAGHQTSRGYDLAGRLVSNTDSDTGTSTTSYNDTGDILSTTDSRPNNTGKVTYIYDGIGRKTEQRTGPDNVLAARWTYDTVRAGMLSSSETFKNGDTSSPYTNRVTSFDAAGRVLRSETVIPASEGVLAGTYGSDTTYTPVGDIKTTTLPAVGTSLPAETINYRYTDQGLPLSMIGTNAYVTTTTYNPYGQLTQYGGRENTSIVLNLTHDTETLKTTQTQMSVASLVSQVDRTSLTYNPAGQIVKSKSVRNLTTSNAPTRTVCYRYDGFQRLTAAWTATDDCVAMPAGGNTSMVGGDVSMWQSWDYSIDGQRTNQTIHQTPGNAAATATTSYTYNTATSSHELDSATTTGGISPQTVSYAYDQAGNTTTRTTVTDAVVTDSFTYTPTGRVATVTNTAGTSAYLYDAAGAVLIRSDPFTGKTLYLGSTQVRLGLRASKPTATRFYSYAGMMIAQRDTGTGLKALYNDPQGTSQVAISWTNLASRNRRTTSPYGTELGMRNGPWPNTLGFGNQPINTHTKLVDMGARLYDPAQGRFLQPDPVIDPSDPDTLNNYTYAANDPINSNDYTGLMRDPRDSRDDSSSGNGACSVGTGRGSFLADAIGVAGKAMGIFLSPVNKALLPQAKTAYSKKAPGVDLVKNVFGFEYNKDSDTFYTNKTSVQRNFGYHDLYDVGSPLFGADISDMYVEFKANEKEYRLWCWKGTYGFDTLYGGEIGLYYKDPASNDPIVRESSKIPGLYAAVTESDEIRSAQVITPSNDPSNELIRNDTIAYAKDGNHYWNYAAKTKPDDVNYDKRNLSQQGTLYVKDRQVYDAMYSALQNKAGLSNVTKGDGWITYTWSGC